MTPDLDPNSFPPHDVPNSSQEYPHHERLQPGELFQIKSNFENSKAYLTLSTVPQEPTFLRSTCFRKKSTSFKAKSTFIQEKSVSFKEETKTLIQIKLSEAFA